MPDNPNRDMTLIRRLVAAGCESSICWTLPGDGLLTAGIACYWVRPADGSGSGTNVIVQTFTEADGWEAWLPAHPGVSIDDTVRAVIEAANCE